MKVRVVTKEGNIYFHEADTFSVVNGEIWIHKDKKLVAAYGVGTWESISKVEHDPS